MADEDRDPEGPGGAVPPAAASFVGRSTPGTRRSWSGSPHLAYRDPDAAQVGPEEPRKYNYHFKNMTTVGEPIEPEVWRRYYSEVGKGEAAITDTWWQTENGGFLGRTLPPCSR